MYGLSKATNYYNNIESKRQFILAVQLAKARGVESDLFSFDPDSVGWRMRDRVTEQIMDLIGISWDELERPATPAQPASSGG